MTRRDLAVAAIASVVTLAGVGLAGQAKPEVMGSMVFDWTTMTATPNNYGEVRQVVRRPTVTLDELEMHITTLKAGETSHAPHKHPNEELVIIREGTVEVLVNGELKRVGSGSIVFQASNQLHNIRNVGTTPATYHVVNWKTAATPKQ